MVTWVIRNQIYIILQDSIEQRERGCGPEKPRRLSEYKDRGHLRSPLVNTDGRSRLEVAKQEPSLHSAHPDFSGWIFEAKVTNEQMLAHTALSEQVHIQSARGKKSNATLVKKVTGEETATRAATRDDDYLSNYLNNGQVGNTDPDLHNSTRFNCFIRYHENLEAKETSNTPSIGKAKKVLVNDVVSYASWTIYGERGSGSLLYVDVKGVWTLI